LSTAEITAEKEVRILLTREALAAQRGPGIRIACGCCRRIVEKLRMRVDKVDDRFWLYATRADRSWDVDSLGASETHRN